MEDLTTMYTIYKIGCFKHALNFLKKQSYKIDDALTLEAYNLLNAFVDQNNCQISDRERFFHLIDKLPMADNIGESIHALLIAMDHFDKSVRHYEGYIATSVAQLQSSKGDWNNSRKKEISWQENFYKILLRQLSKTSQREKKKKHIKTMIDSIIFFKDDENYIESIIVLRSIINNEDKNFLAKIFRSEEYPEVIGDYLNQHIFS